MPHDITAFQAELEKDAIPRYNQILTNSLGATIPIEVDYNSFANCVNPERTFSYTKYWDSYYVIMRIATTLVSLSSNCDAKTEIIQTVKKIVIQHVNEGRAPDERIEFTKADGTLKLVASMCCSTHAFDYWTMYDKVGKELDLLEKYYKKQLTVKCIEEAEQRIKSRLDGQNIPIEVDIESFEKPYNKEDKVDRERYLKALYNASRWSGWHSTEQIWEGIYYIPSDIPSADIVAAVSKIVLHHIKGDSYDKDRNKKLLKFDQASKTLHVHFVHELEYYGRFYYYEIRTLVMQIVKMNKILGNKYTELTEEQSNGKIELLKEICQSETVSTGHFDPLWDLMKWPAFYQPDNREKKAFKKFMTLVNKSSFQEQWPKGDVDDDDEEEPKKEEGEKKDDDKKDDDKKDDDKKKEAHNEQFIAGWNVKKVNYKGMQQDRLCIVTTEATYTVSWDYGSNKPVSEKKIHRIRHNMYQYIDVGEILNKGGPSVPGAGAVDAVANALGAGGGKTHAMRYRSNWPAKDERKKKEFKMPKMPEIPDLKGKILGMFRKAIDAIKSVEFPSFSPPGLPSFDMPNLLDIIEKKSINAVPTTPGTNPYACAAGLAAPSEDLNKFGELKQKATENDKPGGLKMPNMPDFGIPSLLGKIADAIENMADVVFSLPKEFTLTGIMKMMKKSLKKGAGLAAGAMGPLNPVAALGLLKEKITDSELVKSLDNMIETFKKNALPDIEFPPLPTLDLKKVMSSIMEVLGKVKLPDIDFDVKGIFGNISLPGVSLPGVSLPGMPGIPGAGLMNKFKGPEPYPNVEMCMRLHTDGIQSKHLAFEVAWVIWAAGRSFVQPYWLSTPWERTIDIETTMTAKIYNKIGKGDHNKPSKDISDEDLNKVEEAKEEEQPAGSKTAREKNEKGSDDEE